MINDEWLQVHARKDELKRYKAPSTFETTCRKQELVDRVIKAKEDATETIEEKRARKRFEKLEVLKNCAFHLRIFQILKL